MCFYGTGDELIALLIVRSVPFTLTGKKLFLLVMFYWLKDYLLHLKNF